MNAPITKRRRPLLTAFALLAFTAGLVLTSAPSASAQFGFGRGYGGFNRGYGYNRGYNGFYNRPYGGYRGYGGFNNGFYNRGYYGGLNNGFYNPGYYGGGFNLSIGAPLITPPIYGPGYYGGVGGFY